MMKMFVGTYKSRETDAYAFIFRVDAKDCGCIELVHLAGADSNGENPVLYTYLHDAFFETNDWDRVAEESVPEAARIKLDNMRNALSR